MIPLIAVRTVWQSMDMTLEIIAVIVFFGALLTVATLVDIQRRLGQLLKEQRETNRLLGQRITADAASAEASRTVRGPSTAVGMTELKTPPLPPLPKTEPDVYKL